VIKVGMGHEQAGEFQILLDDFLEIAFASQRDRRRGLALFHRQDVDEVCIGPRGS